MNTRAKGNLTEGSINKTLVKLTIPMIAGMMGMTVFNITDTWFVGQLGADELAAMSYTFPVIFVIASIAMGLGVSVSSLVSRAIGEGNHQKVQRLTTDTILLTLVVISFFSATGLLTMDPLFRLLGASGRVLELVREYMFIWYLGLPFVFIPMVGNNAIRATGDTTTPSQIMILAMIVNIILDPLLIFGAGPFPELGLTGAAIATVIARVVTFVAAIYVLHRREKMLSFSAVPVSEVINSWKSILYIGIFASLTNLLMPVSIGIITRVLSGYGDNAVAGFGIGSKLDMCAMAVVAALGSVLAPFVGQNMGAGKRCRVIYGIRSGHIFSMCWGFFVFVIFLNFSREFSRFFNDNREIVNTASTYLVLVSAGYGFQGVLRLTSSAFNALNLPKPSALLMFLQMMVLTVPCVLLGSHFWGVKGIFAALLFSNIVSGSVSFLWIRNVLSGKTAGADCI